MERKHEKTAAEFTKALKNIAKHPKKLENFENYLATHFDVWLKKYAATPEGLTYELKSFSEMEV